jgi:hypothetical protein
MKFTRSAFGLIFLTVILGSMIIALNANNAKPKPITPAPLTAAQIANDAKGNAFCKINCVVNKKNKPKRCLVSKGKLVKCKRCTGKPSNKDKKMAPVCAMVCNANLSANSPCDFYGYNNNKKKKFDVKLLKKYGMVIMRRLGSE